MVKRCSLRILDPIHVGRRRAGFEMNRGISQLDFPGSLAINIMRDHDICFAVLLCQSEYFRDFQRFMHSHSMAYQFLRKRMRTSRGEQDDAHHAIRTDFLVAHANAVRGRAGGALDDQAIERAVQP